jgi:hypothetical protein
VHPPAGSLLTRPVPLWAAAVAVVVAGPACGTFAFGMAFGRTKTGVIKLP